MKLTLILSLWCSPIFASSLSYYMKLGETKRINILNKRVEMKNRTYSLELTTCFFCRIKFTTEYNNFPNHCNGSTISNGTNEDCPCGKIKIKEAIKEEALQKEFCFASNFKYKSSARSMTFVYDFSENLFNASLLFIYTSQKNQQYIKGDIGQSGIIASPNFPYNYKMEVKIEYVLTCSNNVNGDSCKICLLFTDIIPFSSSIMEFFDWNGKLIHFYSGLKLKPAFIMTTGPTMFIKFYSSGGLFKYKAEYSFISLQSNYLIDTECGGEINDSGGTIFMSNTTGFYECSWFIKPTSEDTCLKTHIYLKVITFTGKGKLLIYNGKIPDSEISTSIKDSSPIKEYVAVASDGLHVSFTGTFANSSQLILGYSIFSSSNCMPMVDYRCFNNRCISSTLVCDSIDHCGDNSDEEINCTGYVIPNIHKFWWPSIARDIQFKIPFGVWICGFIFIGITILIILSILRKDSDAEMARSHNNVADEQIRTITLLLSITDSGENEAPPAYEPPPDYNQALSFSYQKLHSDSDKKIISAK